MLRHIVGKMLNLRAVLSFMSLFSSVCGQNYVLQDDYTIANFFNMFSFYTVSGRTIRLTKCLLTNHRDLILLMAMFSMLMRRLQAREVTLLQILPTFI
jgi:hypothetical protein